jgi:SNF2 family DNA or RNA helicase
MRFVAPEEAGSRTQFRERYCNLQVGWHGGIEVNGLREDRKPELFRWLNTRMLRRTKAEIGLQLPPKVVEVLSLDLTTKQAKAYADLQKKMLTELDQGLLVVTDPLVLVNRLRYVASAMPVLSEGGEITELTTPSNKIEALLDIVEQMPDGDPVVVFAESRKLVELAGRELEARGLRCGYITGAVSSQLRAVTVEEFQAGKLDAVLCTTGAGAEGITLTRADTMVFLQRSWSNVANRQAEDRIHRIGASGEFARIYYLMSSGTVDEAVEAAAARKEGWLQEVVRDRDRLRALIGGSL